MDYWLWVTLGGKTSIHCAGGWLLLIVTSVLRVAVLAGYCVIAYDWWRREIKTTSSHGVEALRNLRRIFLFCGLCGYGLPIVMVFVPAWLVTVVALAWLVWFIWWGYIRHLPKLNIIYRDAEIVDEVQKIINGKYEGLSAEEALMAIRQDLKQLIP